MKRARTQSDRGGFTLTEATVAIIFVGLGMAGMLASLSSGTRATQGSYELTRAGFLIREIREYTFAIPFDDLTTQTYSACVDGQGDTMDFDGSNLWSQQITISRRLDSDLESVDASDTSNVKYVTANILYNGQSILEAGWLVTSEVAQ
jgi:type II secretory pathway pseudopilin PulG